MCDKVKALSGVYCLYGYGSQSFVRIDAAGQTPAFEALMALRLSIARPRVHSWIPVLWGSAVVLGERIPGDASAL